MLGAKQHTVVFLPFALMLTRDRRFWTTAAVTLAAIVLPFVLMDPRAFWNEAVRFHLLSPYRSDALNLTAYVWRNQGLWLPGWAPLLPGLGVLWLAARRRPFRLAEFFQYSGAFYFAVLLLSKHAFMNYYHLVSAVWLLGAAASWCEAGTAWSDGPDSGQSIAATSSSSRPISARIDGSTLPSSAGTR
jgi:hypothetical protein